MRALGITRVFDLRSDTEIEKYGAPLPVIEGVEILHTPVFQKDDYSPEVMAKYVRVILLRCNLFPETSWVIQAIPAVCQRKD
jgi:hypothetical protein